MKLLGLQHCSLVVTNLEASQYFYEQMLGMRNITPSFHPPTVRWLESAGTEIHLIQASEYHNGPSPARSDEAMRDGGDTHLAFVVASIEDAQAHCLAHNIEIICGPRQRDDGPQQLYVCDPDGYLIELFEWR